MTGLLVALSLVMCDGGDVAQHLQDISVTIRAGTSEGSGVIVTREIDGKNVNFVWTAGHVVEGLKSTRTVVDAAGQERKVVEFKEPKIVKHVGSLLGEAGANSMTTGIVSQVGRTLDLGSGRSQVFDQTTATAFPGSSGGGVFTTEGNLVGVLVRGAGENFNLIVPVRRLREYCDEVGITWAIDASVKCPTLEAIEEMPVTETTFDKDGKDGKTSSGDGVEVDYLIREIQQ